MNTNNNRLWPDDAPEGKTWKCPDCGSQATLGGNAGFHRDKEKHGEPILVDFKAPLTFQPPKPVRQFLVALLHDNRIVGCVLTEQNQTREAILKLTGIVEPHFNIDEFYDPQLAGRSAVLLGGRAAIQYMLLA
jgi:hypothetical protein